MVREDVTMTKPIIQTYYHPFEITIPGAGQKVLIEQPLPLNWDEAVGVVLINPGGNHGKGIFELSVGGEEIFPSGFHARAYMQTLSSNYQDAIIVKELDRYMYAIQEAAKGATVKASYSEPQSGSKGMLYLYIKLTRELKL